MEQPDSLTFFLFYFFSNCCQYLPNAFPRPGSLDIHSKTTARFIQIAGGLRGDHKNLPNKNGDNRGEIHRDSLRFCGWLGSQMTNYHPNLKSERSADLENYHELPWITYSKGSISSKSPSAGRVYVIWKIVSFDIGHIGIICVHPLAIQHSDIGYPIRSIIYRKCCCSIAELCWVY
jgi:hypothetical protein